MPTNNPVPSADPSDLAFNAGAFDRVVNGEAPDFTDRFGRVKKTVAGSISQVQAAAEQALAVDIPAAIGTVAAINSRGNWASGTAYAIKDIVLTGGTWYICIVAHTSSASFATDQAARWRVYQGLTTGDLEYQVSEVQSVIDSALPMQNYTALRAYTGRATAVRITTPGIAGFFQRDDGDTTTADDGGTVIVDASGRRWRRLYSGAPHVLWFGAVPDFNPANNTGTDNSAAFNALLQNFPVADCSGDYKFMVLSAIAPNRKFILTANGSTICQRTKTQPLFNLNGCSGSEIHYGDFTNNATLAEYELANARLIFANQHVEDITIYNAKVFKTFQQGIDFDLTSARINIVLCHVEETARDGIFLLNSVDSKVSLCTFVNTGDDSIAFAGQSHNAIASSNTITGAGSYNLGGSGIRINRSGVAVGNTIKNSDLFGIICADNSVDATAKPENLKLIGNTIVGINKTGTVTAGIGFKNVTSVECIGNDIRMPSKEAHAYRLYGETKSGRISIDGGTVDNARSVLFIRDAGADSIKVSNVTSKQCTDLAFLEATGAVDVLELAGNTSINTTSSGYFRAGTNTATVGKLITRNNKLLQPNTVPFVFNSASIAEFESTKDQWATNIHADYNGGTNVSSIVIDGRMGEITSARGVVTFNATNSGLISFGATPLSRIPLRSDLSIVLETVLGAASYWYVDFIDAVNFRIRLNAAPGVDVTFSWSVNAFNNRKVK